MKWRYFRSLLNGGDDPDSERVYRWHIATRRASGFVDGSKAGLEDYTAAAKALAVSMTSDGFDPMHAIPIDPDGELLGGAHRTACAIALGIHVFAQPNTKRAWAPDWGRAWFREYGLSEQSLARLQTDWDYLNEKRQSHIAGSGRRGKADDNGSLPANP